MCAFSLKLIMTANIEEIKPHNPILTDMGSAGGGVHGQRRQLSNEIRAIFVDHVINHGLTM